MNHKEPSHINVKRTAELLDILKDVDSVELKLTVPDSDRSSAITALDMDVLEAELRQVVFFDTPDLRLRRGGVVVRARRIRNDGDSVVKLRPLVPSDVPAKIRRLAGFKIELDASPASFVCSGSLKANADNTSVKEVLRGKKPIRSLFSREQREFYVKHAPRHLAIDSLTPFGPINVAKLKVSPKKFGRTMTAELWFYPDGSRILELSTKCAHDKAFEVAAEARVFLTGCGISLTGEQQTKTHKALEHFSRLYGKKQSRPAA